MSEQEKQTQQELPGRVGELLDELIREYGKPEDILSESGLLQFNKALIERAVIAKMTQSSENENGTGDGSPAATTQTLLDQFASAISSQEYYDIPVEAWEAEYREGKWDYLNSLSALPRYAVIAGYVRRLKPNCAVLDIGCGEGILQEQLKDAYTYYAGIDISEAAVERAYQRQDAQTQFVVADATIYTPDRTYDVIVFNECLYYFPDVLDVVQNYVEYLNPDGLLIVSMCSSPTSARIWKQLERVYKEMDSVQLANATNLEWVVKALVQK